MTPQEFQRRWRGSALTEKQSYQLHFCDLCELAAHPKPSPETGDWFCFERGAEKLDGGNGWADVWKRGSFAFEYKGPHKDLDAAYRQLQQYRDDLENPPLLVTCDTDRLVIRTNFTGTVVTTHTLGLADLARPEGLDLLRKLFHQPEALRPETTPEQVTEQAAETFAALADALAGRAAPDQVAHFIMRLVFCLFAEDIGLLPGSLFSRLVTSCQGEPARFEERCAELFRAMSAGSELNWQPIPHFNGGLFDGDQVLPVEPEGLKALATAARLDWSQVHPAIFGTLFQRILDPARRAQRGAHYTSPADIDRVIQPVIMDPLRAEWEAVKADCEPLLADYQRAAEEVWRNVAGAAQRRNNARLRLDRAVRDFHDRLRSVTVLDPACGSGNFLYLALVALKNLEREVFAYSQQWGAPMPTEQVEPTQLRGLEIEPYAAELAQVTIWIGYLQWTHQHGWPQRDDPILSPHRSIECRDAILTDDGQPAEWPAAEFIVGNPPFLGGKRLRAELGDEYIDRLFAAYAGQPPREADLCCYWFERARGEIAAGRARRAGLLATNSIRQGPQMRPVLQRIGETGRIFLAWADEPWILDGAAVRISIVGFEGPGGVGEPVLDGQPVARINPDLTSGLDLTVARRLKANAGLCFMGDTKGGAFDIPGELARRMLAAPNPLGRDNADVVKPWWNGLDVTRRPRDMWIIDFGLMPAEEAALYEAPFEYIREHVLPVRRQNARASYRDKWWLHVEPRPAMRAALAGLPRYLATAIVAKYRLFAFLDQSVLADHKLIVFARDDDCFFGVLHSWPHELWSLRTCSWQGKGNDPVYTPTTCFETFPFPRPTPEREAAIAAAAKALHETRQSALDNDPKLTLTGLYNKRPTWLQNLHAALDAAVLAAYGWPADIPDEELLERLLALNLERAAEEAGA